MEYLNKQKGFSLVEIIISIAIISIIIVLLSTVFVNSYKLINYSGEKVQILYELQSQIEQTIGNQISTAGNEATLNINFSTRSISIEGRKIEVNEEYRNKDITLFYFMAN